MINGYNRLIGIVERDVLITLIEKEAWYYPDHIRNNSNFGTAIPKQSPKALDTHISEPRKTSHSINDIDDNSNYSE